MAVAILLSSFLHVRSRASYVSPCSFQSFPIPFMIKPFQISRVQPNVDTRAKQMDAWCDLISAYGKHHRMFRLNISEAIGSPLFSNAAIDR